jgi:hypothetical protein
MVPSLSFVEPISSWYTSRHLREAKMSLAFCHLCGCQVGLCLLGEAAAHRAGDKPAQLPPDVKACTLGGYIRQRWLTERATMVRWPDVNLTVARQLAAGEKL